MQYQTFCPLDTETEYKASMLSMPTTFVTYYRLSSRLVSTVPSHRATLNHARLQTRSALALGQLTR